MAEARTVKPTLSRVGEALARSVNADPLVSLLGDGDLLLVGIQTAFSAGMKVAMRHPEWAQAALAEIDAQRNDDALANDAESADRLVRRFPIEASS